MPCVRKPQDSFNCVIDLVEETRGESPILLVIVEVASFNSESAAEVNLYFVIS